MNDGTPSSGAESIPALVWQSDIEALAVPRLAELVALIDSRHAVLLANFNQYIVSDAAMLFCARIQRHVLACYERDGYGLLRRRDNGG